jgi:hypothetical protein
MPLRSGDRYVAPANDVGTLHHPTGVKMTLTCRGRTEFIPQGSESTEICAFHDHTLVGGTWFWRQDLRKSDQESQSRVFERSIERCEAALQSQST